MPDACLWPGLSWLNLGFSSVLTTCKSWAIFFVTSFCVNLIVFFAVMMHCISYAS